MFSALAAIRKPDRGQVQVVETTGMLLGIERTSAKDGHPQEPVYRGVPPHSIYNVTVRALSRQPTECLDKLWTLDLATVDDGIAHEVFAKTLQTSFLEAGGSFAGSSTSLAPPWASAISRIDGENLAHEPTVPIASRSANSVEDSFGDGGGLIQRPTGVVRRTSLEHDQPVDTSVTKSLTSMMWKGETPTNEGDNGDASAAIYSLKRVVLDVTRRLVADNNRLPLRNHTTAVLIDGSRMSLLALELAGACWKFGRFIVVHVSGEGDPRDVADFRTHKPDHGSDDGEAGRVEGVLRRGGSGAAGRQGVVEGEGRWKLGFLQEELREICLRQLEIPEECLEVVCQTLPPGSSGVVGEVTDAIDAVLSEHQTKVVFMGSYGRRGPRVARFGRVALWAMEETPYQVVFAKQFSPSMVSPDVITRPKRYLVAVTADLEKASRMLDRLLPLISPCDLLTLLHIVDESIEDIIAGETVDEEQIQSDLASLLSNKPGLSCRVRVEKTGRPPEHPTQTVVQRVVKAVVDEAADFLVILHDESRGSYRTVATGCLREARCSLVAIHL